MVYNVLLFFIDFWILCLMFFYWVSVRFLYVGFNKISVLNMVKMIVVESIVWVNRVWKIVNCKYGFGKKIVIFFFVVGVSLKKNLNFFFF